ncbi:MAG: hypothetical protein Q4P66_09470 [Actinomycetaceae bacterium]|nr:hypothetical protein [Actinomycetaceae bacterium]
MSAMTLASMPTLGELSINHQTMFIAGIMGVVALIILLIGIVNASAAIVIASGIFTAASVFITLALHIHAVENSTHP